MEKLNFGYSLKNMPRFNEKSYKLHLLEKIEMFIKKCFVELSFYKKQRKTTENDKQSFSYGLISSRSPP